MPMSTCTEVKEELSRTGASLEISIVASEGLELAPADVRAMVARSARTAQRIHA